MAQVTPAFGGKRLLFGASMLAVVGIVGLTVSFGMDPTRSLYAYLMAFAYCVSICVGALFVLMIGYTINASWMSVIRRLCEAVAIGVVPLLLLFVPIGLGLERLYVWVSPPDTLPDHVLHLLHHKAPYLNPTFFVGRTLFYFAVWIVGAVLLRRWSRKRDERPLQVGTEALSRERAFSSVMLVLVALTTTFAAFDWLMSLRPTWYSSMFGVYYFAGAFLSAIAAISILAYASARRGITSEAISVHHFHALGRLLFAFTVFWAYIAYFQVFLISIADRPVEVSYYLDRLDGGWGSFVYILTVGHFVIPFLLLLPKRVKFRPGYVAALASWILLMHFADICWLALPDRGADSLHVGWVEIAALLAVGGITVAFCAFGQRGVPVVATGDPLLSEGIHYASPQ